MIEERDMLTRLYPGKKRLFALALLLLLLCIAEGIVRLFGFQPALPLDADKPSVTGYFWVCDRELGFRNRANGSYRYEEIRSNPLVTTDATGFRNGRGWDPMEAGPTIVLLGDSTVFCAEVDDDETVASELALLLSDQWQVRVLNAGVRGYNTLQCARMLERCINTVSSVVVAVYCYCGNDITENLNPDEYYPARAPALRWNEGAGRWDELEVTNATVAWGSSFLDVMMEERKARRSGSGSKRKRFDQVIRDRVRERSAFFHLLQSRLSALRDGPDETTQDRADVPESECMHSESEYETGRAGIIHLFRRMDELCRRRGVDFAVTGFTVGEECNTLASWCLEAGVRFVPLHGSFKGRSLSYNARLREGGYDPHYGSKGTRTFATALTPTLNDSLAARSDVARKE